MAGTQAGFSAATFRNKIQFVMGMATPTGTNEQITFHFADAVTVTAAHDGEKVPFDPTATVTVVTPNTLQTVCLVTYLDAGDQPTAFGTVKASSVRVDQLDEQYALVKAATHVTVRGDTYLYDFEPPAVGLFDVTLHSIHYKGVDET